MFHCVAIALVLAVAVVCFSALGVGAGILAKLLVALFLIAGTAFLIAWPFLRKRSSR